MSPSSCQGTASAVHTRRPESVRLQALGRIFQARTRTPEGTRLPLSGGEVE